MINKQFFTLLFVGVLLSIGCNNEQNETATSLHFEIMKEHDKVMPKVTEINRLKRQLKVYKDIVPDENALLKDSLINGILLLSKSEDIMSDWMANYKYPDPNRSVEDMVKYLTAQKDSIMQVGNDIFMSLSVGKSLISNAPDSIKTEKHKITDNHTNH